MSSNNFDRDVLARYYDDHENCLLCKRNGADCFHHAIPRARPFSNSVFNATPLHNQTCNIARHGEIHQPEQTLAFIETNVRRLLRLGYRPNDNDLRFLETYAPRLLTLLETRP